uniref:Uncharacterized protein n=1 Tax=Leersia perrieri TaxID=77586 RepID=A0A0D9X5I1_9ORYZ
MPPAALLGEGWPDRTAAAPGRLAPCNGNGGLRHRTPPSMLSVAGCHAGFLRPRRNPRNPLLSFARSYVSCALHVVYYAVWSD